MTRKRNPPTPGCDESRKPLRIGKTVYPKAVVICCGCDNEIEPSQVADCPHCKAAGKDWNR